MTEYEKAIIKLLEQILGKLKELEYFARTKR